MNKIFFICLLGVSAISCKSQVTRATDKYDIVIINIGKRFRVGIAKEISLINSFDPKVIALDIYFKDQENPYSDSLLISTLGSCKNLIMTSFIDQYSNGNGKSYNQLTGSLPKFLANSKIGFANNILENDQFQTLKRFSIYEDVDGEIIYHFALRAAMEYDSLRTMKFIQGKPRVIDVDYVGGEKMFKTFSDFDVFDGKVTKKDIEGKIVLFGYLGPYDGYDEAIDEDRFFSPLNAKVEPYKSDMYGVVVHANIIAQVLRQTNKK